MYDMRRNEFSKNQCVVIFPTVQTKSGDISVLNQASWHISSAEGRFRGSRMEISFLLRSKIRCWFH